MSDDIKPGDMVELISGGPVMAVVSVSKQEMADVVWREAGSEHGFKRHTLPLIALRKRHVRQLEGDPDNPGFCREASFDRNLIDAIERNADAVREAIAPRPDPVIGGTGEAFREYKRALAAEGIEPSPKKTSTCVRCDGRLYYRDREVVKDGMCSPCRRRADDHVHQVDIEPEAILSVLRSPEGRAAIADVIQDPPLRGADPSGRWREASEQGKQRTIGAAKPGDWVRNRGTGAAYRVLEIREAIGAIVLDIHGDAHVAKQDDYTLIPEDSAHHGKWSEKP